MSFWNLNDATEKLDTTGKFEAGGGAIEPIPADTQVKAAIDEVKWHIDDFIELRWTVLAPAEYKNRKVFQKIRVFDEDSKKADKAKRMLAAIATNTGGGLLKIEGKPTDQDMQKHLLMKPMALTLQVWELEKDNGEMMSGNWVQQVAPLRNATPPPPPPPSDDFDGIPF